MRIAITGHTSGIGKALYQRLDNALGFSLSTGYNITNPVERTVIVSQAHDCDVFINNAFDGYGQCEMLFDMWKSWLGTGKTIVSIGSDVTNYTMSSKRLEMLDYYNYKFALKDLNQRLQNLNNNVTLKYVSFGYVATDKTLQKNIPAKMMISVEQAVETILESIKCE